MYDELVKRIRGCSYSDPNGCEECRDCPNAENYYECKQKLALQAADAIEELSKYANTIMRLKSEGWYLQQTKHHDCYEAISTMPLPEPPKEEAQ